MMRIKRVAGSQPGRADGFDPEDERQDKPEQAERTEGALERHCPRITGIWIPEPGYQNEEHRQTWGDRRRCSVLGRHLPEMKMRVETRERGRRPARS